MQLDPLSLTTIQRMEMIQEGYNPLQIDSIKAWLEKKKPDFSLAKSVAKAKRENLGSKSQNDSRDFSVINKDLGSSEGIDFDAEENHVITNPREHISKLVNEDYQYQGGNAWEGKLRSRLETSPLKETTRKTIQPIRNVMSQKQMITETKVAANLGYKNGVSYLNSFVNLIKEPSSQARQKFIEQINTMILTEDEIEGEAIKYYRGGIAKAEKEMFQKLKK